MIYISIYVGRRRHKNEMGSSQLQLTWRTHRVSVKQRVLEHKACITGKVIRATI